MITKILTRILRVNNLFLKEPKKPKSEKTIIYALITREKTKNTKIYTTVRVRCVMLQKKHIPDNKKNSTIFLSKVYLPGIFLYLNVGIHVYTVVLASIMQQ